MAACNDLQLLQQEPAYMRPSPKTHHHNVALPFTAAGSPALGGILQNITLQLLPANTTEYQAARTFAALGTSLWDVTVTLWYFRFKALRWRPITAIRCARAAVSGAPATLQVQQQYSGWEWQEG